MARKTHHPIGVSKVENQGVVAKHREPVAAKCGGQSGFAGTAGTGEGEHRSSVGDGGRMDWQQSIHARHGGIDAAVEPQRFLARVGIRTAMHRYPFAGPIEKIMLALGPQEERALVHLPAHFVERPVVQEGWHRTIGDPGFALQHQLGGRFYHLPRPNRSAKRRSSEKGGGCTRARSLGPVDSAACCVRLGRSNSGARYFLSAFRHLLPLSAKYLAPRSPEPGRTCSPAKSTLTKSRSAS